MPRNVHIFHFYVCCPHRCNFHGSGERRSNLTLASAGMGHFVSEKYQDDQAEALCGATNPEPKRFYDSGVS